MSTKICTKCQQNKPISEFRTRRNHTDQYHSWCKECTTAGVVKKRQENKQKAIDYKGGKCQICDYDKCVASLHFHHLDPAKKSFSITSQLREKTSFESILEELDKCLLVCANCHGEIHSGQVDLDSFIGF